MPEFKGRLRTPRLSAAPSSPLSGELYYDTGTNTLYLWNGTAWVNAASDQLKVDKDAVVTALIRLVSTKLIITDTQPAFRILGDGRHDWGPGGSVAPDSSLYRIAAAVLRIDGGLSMGGILSNHSQAQYGYILATGVTGDTQNRMTIQNTGHLYWGPGGAVAPDTNLYRGGVAMLNTDGGLTAQGVITALTFGSFSSSALVAALQTALGGDTQYRFVMDSNGNMSWGSGAAIRDLNLYRSSPGWLTTDYSFWAKGSIYTDGAIEGSPLLSHRPLGSQIALGIYLNGDVQDRFDVLADGTLRWGNGIAVPNLSLYKYGTDALGLSAALAVRHDWGIWTEGSSPAASSVLSHYAPGNDSQPRIRIDGTGKLNWGPGGSTAPDTNLYRSAVDTLKTDDKIDASGGFFINGVAVGGGDLVYNGDFPANTPYTDGDIVMYNGVPYMCVRPTSVAPTAWPTPGTDTAWHVIGTAGEPPYLGAWGALAGWPAPRFRKLSSGLVVIRGLANGGAQGTTIFTLPAGYRPGDNIRFLVNNSWRADSVEVQTGGNLAVPFRNDSGWLDLGCISFYAEG